MAWSSIKSRAIYGCARNCRNAAPCGVGVLFFLIIGADSEYRAIYGTTADNYPAL